MRAITVIPGHAGSARLDDLPEPASRGDELLVEGLALGHRQAPGPGPVPLLRRGRLGHVPERPLHRAAEALARAEAGWLEGLVSRRVPLPEWERALERREEDVKVVIELGGSA